MYFDKLDHRSICVWKCGQKDYKLIIFISAAEGLGLAVL